jgi:hypothetical protein
VTPDEAFDLGYAAGLAQPLSQAQADRCAAILAPYWPMLADGEPRAA